VWDWPSLGRNVAGKLFISWLLRRTSAQTLRRVAAFVDEGRPLDEVDYRGVEVAVGEALRRRINMGLFDDVARRTAAAIPARPELLPIAVAMARCAATERVDSADRLVEIVEINSRELGESDLIRLIEAEVLLKRFTEAMTHRALLGEHAHLDSAFEDALFHYQKVSERKMPGAGSE
jgi:hypothetical protein